MFAIIDMMDVPVYRNYKAWILFRLMSMWDQEEDNINVSIRAYLVYLRSSRGHDEFWNSSTISVDHYCQIAAFCELVDVPCFMSPLGYNDCRFPLVILPHCIFADNI